MNYKSSFSRSLGIRLQAVYDLQEVNSSVPTKQDAVTWFKNYLLTMHSIIRSSVPLMKAAYDRCGYLTGETKLITDLTKYYKKHIHEEMNHDDWLLDDLESIGVSRNECLLRMPLQAVAVVGTQYYWVYHWHPVSLLGYISFLEGNPPKMELIEHLQKITGYPETGFRTLVKHSDLDPHHRSDLNELLEALPLTPRHEKWITSNALYCAYKLSEIMSHPNRDE
jgi:hypothetical protein